jgi:multiple sugar transport system permease protein
MTRAGSAEWKSFQYRFNKWMSYAFLILVLVLILIPVFWLVISAVKKPDELYAYPLVFLAKVPQWDNFIKVFTMMPFMKVAWRTVVLSITSGALTVLTSSMCGYAFARYQVPANKIIFPAVVALLIVPSIVTLIPQFILYTRLKLTNTYLPWYLGALGASPYFIFMFRQFFYGFPHEIEEAAEIDGCDPIRMYWQIFLPNAMPVLATASIYGHLG